MERLKKKKQQQRTVGWFCVRNCVRATDRSVHNRQCIELEHKLLAAIDKSLDNLPRGMNFFVLASKKSGRVSTRGRQLFDDYYRWKRVEILTRNVWRGKTLATKPSRRESESCMNRRSEEAQARREPPARPTIARRRPDEGRSRIMRAESRAHSIIPGIRISRTCNR